MPIYTAPQPGWPPFRLSRWPHFQLTKTNGSGVVQDQRAYDPFGRVTHLQGVLASDRQFGGYYMHAPSGLNLTRTRAYSANLARFIRRDPLAEVVGTNLYMYVHNNPELWNDPSGQAPLLCPFVPPDPCEHGMDRPLCRCLFLCALAEFQVKCTAACLAKANNPFMMPLDWQDDVQFQNYWKEFDSKSATPSHGSGF